MDDGFMHLEPAKQSLKLQLNRITYKSIVLRYGHIAITDYELGDNWEFEKLLSVYNEIEFKYNRVAGHYVKELKEFRIQRGFNLEHIARLFKNYKVWVDMDSFPEVRNNANLLVGPKDDLQTVGLTFLCSQGEFKKNASYTNLMVQAHTGAGKAMPDDTEIPTPSGVVKLKDLKVGDKVFNRHGKPVDVLAIYSQGMQVTYGVYLDDGRWVDCNPEHLWTVYDENNEMITISTADMIDNMSSKKFYLPIAGPVEFEHIYLGDNPSAYNYGVTYAAIHDMVYDIDFTLSLYTHNDIETRKEFLRGLIDGTRLYNPDDADRDMDNITTNNIRVADTIAYVARSLGYRVTIHTFDELNTPVSCDTAYRIRISKIDKARITKIKLRPEKTAQRCILVDDSEHLYLAGEFIPTHNTYLGTATSCFMHARTLVVIPISTLADQWKEAFLKFTDMEEEDILTINKTGSNVKICEDIVDGKYADTKVFIIHVATLMAYRKKHGDMGLIDLLSSTKCYLKIVDEIHRDMSSVNIIDALSNFRMNIYLSATPTRTQKKEKFIFSQCFWNVPRFGNKFNVDEEKYINVMVKVYSFVPTSLQMKSMIQPRTKWLNSASYEKTLITATEHQLTSFIASVRGMLTWSKKMLKTGKRILFMCQTVDGVNFIYDIAKTVFPESDIGKYYMTGMTKEEREISKKKTLIIATSKSTGTGFDLTNDKGENVIQFVHNMVTYSNAIDSVQNSGRARKLKDGTPVFYIEYVNFGYKKTLNQYLGRKPALLKVARNNQIQMIQ